MTGFCDVWLQINWPFDPASVELQANFSDRFAALSNPNHTVTNRFKLYYTARELTNHVAELFPLRALDGEILIGKAVSAAQAAAGGSTSYLLEHLVEDYIPCVSRTVSLLRVIFICHLLRFQK